MQKRKTRSARAGRSARKDRTPSAPAQLAWQNLRSPYTPMQVLGEEALELIHDASMRILEQIGLEMLSEEARELAVAHGAHIDSKTNYVRFERDIVMKHVAAAPREFTLHARNPARNSVYGGNHINFGIVSSAPNCSDLDNGRRPGNFADFCKFLQLAQFYNVVSLISGYPVEPADLPVPTRHLDAYLACITLSDKPWHVYSLGGGRVEDGIEMVCIARGVDKEQLRREPSLVTVVNTNSPLKVDKPMLDGAFCMARHGQPVIVTPFTLAGAMSPVTLAGALAQQNAEALGVIALIQMAAPGAPVMYGGFTSNVDMKSGSPAFGTPEYAKATLAGGQLARRYALPYRTSNVNAANCVDAQAAWESEMSLWSAVLAHGNMIKHSGGWLEGGLCASFEKLIVDMEMVQMMAETLSPPQVNEETLALEAIREVGAGGHFFGSAHTIARYENAFYAPQVSDWRNFETWQEDGARTAAQRANTLCKQILASCEAPPLDPAVREELDAFVARRRAEIDAE